ncbi:MAG: metal-dependent transcriptional regulator [Ruminococcus sp.]|nr:metal-dependent transcriptional regulator [Ruminococcus sp.]
MAIRESGEDYLETILIIGSRKGFVRSVDIAEELGYSKPSISRAVSVLKKSGYIAVGNDGEITLTEAGKELAERVYKRHKTIKNFFIKILGVSPETAETDACRAEHALSEETFIKLESYLENAEG